VAATSEIDQPGSTTVHRAMALLTVLGEAPAEGMRIAALTQRIGANRSTVYRIIEALKPYGFVRSGEFPGTVRLGFGLVELADRALDRLDVRQVSSRQLRALAAETGETCHLAIVDQDEVVYIDKAESNQDFRLASRPGKRMPLHSTSLGKAFLAAMAPDERTAVLDRIELTARTASTIADREALEADLELVAQRGWATDVGENSDGVHCVAAAIFGRDDRPLAAISITAPAHRLTGETFGEYGRIALLTARTISAGLGHSASLATNGGAATATPGPSPRPTHEAEDARPA
jgi:IclR family acetate operon transcriptional repressor